MRSEYFEFGRNETCENGGQFTLPFFYLFYQEKSSDLRSYFEHTFHSYLSIIAQLTLQIL